MVDSLFLFIGKDYTLLHQAPIVSVFILDHIGLPLASLYEVDNQIVPRKYYLHFVTWSHTSYIFAYYSKL